MGSKPPIYSQYRLYYERNLPHYQPPGAILFITFRLAGSIPAHLLAELQQRIDRAGKTSPEQLERFQKYIFTRWDQILDSGESGPVWLKEPAVAQMVQESLQYRDGKDYELHAYCIMLNHVHLVCSPIAANGQCRSMIEILRSLKGYTAYRANLILGRKGPFWQHESYDHVIRDEEEYRRVVAYVVNNPVKAGLVERAEDWAWMYAREQG